MVWGESEELHSIGNPEVISVLCCGHTLSDKNMGIITIHLEERVKLDGQLVYLMRRLFLERGYLNSLRLVWSPVGYMD
jgi:hypothetical protein